MTDQPSIEQRVLRIMRKVLSNVVRDAAPRAGMPSCLSDSTVEDIRRCFELIAIREQELANLDQPERPHYAGDSAARQPVVFHASRKPDENG